MVAVVYSVMQLPAHIHALFDELARILNLPIAEKTGNQAFHTYKITVCSVLNLSQAILRRYQEKS